LPDMIIMVGLPLSGKSTLAEKMAQGISQGRGPSYTIVCPDDVRMALYNQEFWGPADPMVWGIVDVMARSLLLRGQRIIVDATNVTRWERAKWTRLAKDFDIEYTFSNVQTSVEECVERARLDGREEMIPVIERLYSKFQNIESYEWQ